MSLTLNCVGRLHLDNTCPEYPELHMNACAALVSVLLLWDRLEGHQQYNYNKLECTTVTCLTF